MTLTYSIFHTTGPTCPLGGRSQPGLDDAGASLEREAGRRSSKDKVSWVQWVWPRPGALCQVHLRGRLARTASQGRCWEEASLCGKSLTQSLKGSHGSALRCWDLSQNASLLHKEETSISESAMSQGRGVRSPASLSRAGTALVRKSLAQEAGGGQGLRGTPWWPAWGCGSSGCL